MCLPFAVVVCQALRVVETPLMRWPAAAAEGGIRGDQVKMMNSSTAQRRSFYHQRGPERRLPDAPYYSDGVIRSTSLQHSPASHLLGSSGPYSNRYHNAINRSHSSSGVESNSIRHHNLKKTVRFDAEDDCGDNDDDDGTWMTGSSKDSAGWDWLLTTKPSTAASGRQESRESAARDSGVETLTSGEGELSVTPYDLKFNKVPPSPPTKDKETTEIIKKKVVELLVLFRATPNDDVVVSVPYLR